MSRFRIKLAAAAAVAAIASATPAAAFATTIPGPGYRAIQKSGTEYAYNDVTSTFTTVQPNVPVPAGDQVVAAAANPVGPGHWLLLSSGGVLAEGGAPWFGSPAAQFHTAVPASSPMGIAALPDGLGYYVLFANGSVFNYGTATWKGSPYQAYGGHAPPMWSIATTATGYLVTGFSGGVYNYGTTWYGSPRALGVVTTKFSAAGWPNFPVQILAAPNGGYYVLGLNASVWAFNAPWYGSPYQQFGDYGFPFLMELTRDGTGYRVGNIYGGLQLCYGSTSSSCPSLPAALTATTFGYYVAMLPGA